MLVTRMSVDLPNPISNIALIFELFRGNSDSIIETLYLVVIQSGGHTFSVL